MRAVILSEHGDRNVLKAVNDFPKPTTGRNEVLLKIQATSINQVDLVIRRGYPGLTLPLPHILGGDIVGIVAETGTDVTGIPIGTRAVVYPVVACNECQLCHEGQPILCLNWQYFGMHRAGGYGEYVAVPVDCIIPLPDAISFETAAALPVAGLTAFHGLKTVGELRSGQTFFIWGGSGGLGTLAIQTAKALGARVIATGGSEKKLQIMSGLGADYVFNRHTADIPKEIRKITPAGVDLVMNYVGPETFNASFNMLKKGGTMLLCGIITGRETMVNLHMTYLRHLSIKGFYLGTKPEMLELLDLVSKNLIKPHIHTVLPLEEAVEAHHLLESGEVIGKIVLSI
ncbi:MAG: zinc-binding dehydrogenase [Candidatus Marinimicrobia bacterium]|nr:zinc-binding dehydrogenase [Candidatus Neomarinimicrobiota bacterium]